MTKKYKFFVVLLLLLTVVLAINALLNDKGYSRYAEVKNKLGEIQQENELLLNTNQELRAQIKELFENVLVYESIARKKDGMVKENELFIRLIE